jgi:histidine phosphotransfer protein HptB
VQDEKIAVQTPPGLPARMVTDYIQRYLAGLPAARASLAGLDHDALRVYGHRLKGSGSGYGVPRLTEFGALIEDSARRGDTGALQNQFAELEAYLGRLEVIPD